MSLIPNIWEEFEKIICEELDVNGIKKKKQKQNVYIVVFFFNLPQIKNIEIYFESFESFETFEIST